MSLINFLYLVVTGIGAAGCFTFVVSYWIRTRGAWWKLEAGKFLMVVNFNLGVLFLLVMANQVFGEWPGRRELTLVLFITYVVESWWPLRLLFRADREPGEEMT